MSFRSNRNWAFWQSPESILFDFVVTRRRNVFCSSNLIFKEEFSLTWKYLLWKAWAFLYFRSVRIVCPYIWKIRLLWLLLFLLSFARLSHFQTEYFWFHQVCQIFYLFVAHCRRLVRLPNSVVDESRALLRLLEFHLARLRLFWRVTSRSRQVFLLCSSHELLLRCLPFMSEELTFVGVPMGLFGAKSLAPLLMGSRFVMGWSQFLLLYFHDVVKEAGLFAKDPPFRNV